MPLNKEDVDAAFRLILGDAAKERAKAKPLLKDAQDIEELRARLLTSPSFHQAQAKLSAQQKHQDDRGGVLLDLARPKIVFLHIPKTGGTTMADLLSSNFSRHEVFRQKRDVEMVPAAVLARHRVFFGHYTLHQIAHIPGAKRIYTVLREPRARVLSMYRYHKARMETGRSEGKAIEQKTALSLNAYLRDPRIRNRPSVRNLQTRYLFHVSEETMVKYRLRPSPYPDMMRAYPKDVVLEIAKDNLRSLAGVGVLERFDEFVRMFFAEQGLRVPSDYVARNVTTKVAATGPKPAGPIDFDQPDEETQHLLDDLVDLDEQMYRLAGQLFTERMMSRAAEQSGPPQPGQPQPGQRQPGPE